MQERDMVLDVLSGTKASLNSYAKSIIECNDQHLRQTFQQMRDSDEKFQYDLYKIAASKGYYNPSPESQPMDTASIKTKLTQSVVA